MQDTKMSFGSKSDPHKRYFAELKADGTKTCSCPGWQFNSTCWHMDEVIKVADRNARQENA